MSKADAWSKELDRLEQGRSSYVWDEIEELITDDYSDERITEAEFEILMRRLMDIDCDL